MGLVANCFPLVIAVLSPHDPAYPTRLRALGWDRSLDVRGNTACLTAERSVAIVGSRAASGTGMARAHALAKHLAGAGVHVVSGGALGIDGAAHRGALAGGGTTTVVLGSGIDVAYPVRHLPLFEQILQRGGALVSMLPRGTEPRPHTFPMRNPLIAALADIVIVVEADVRSGSLSTAKAARDQQRIVGAWPGSPGCERLLRDGAAIVENVEDVHAALAGTPRTFVAVPLDADAAQVRAAIDAGITGIDAIVRHTGLSVRSVLRAYPIAVGIVSSARYP
jgi:DNA processing protein